MITVPKYSSTQHILIMCTVCNSVMEGNNFVPKTLMGTAVAQWLRHCATNRKVAGSIPDGVIGIFH